MLLVRESDVEADGLCVHVRRPAIGGLHDAGSSASNDDVVTATFDLAGRGNQPAKLTRHVIVL